MKKIRTPFFEIGTKNYIYGDDVLKLAMAADKMAEKYDIDVLMTTPYADIRRVAENTKNLIIIAPYMDTLYPGRGMAAVLPESLKAAGAHGVVINHCEKPMSLPQMKETIKRAREMDFIVFACADTTAEAQALAHLKPDIINPEPSELIGGNGGQVSDMGFVKQTIDAIKAIDDSIYVEQAAGITTGEQVYDFIMAGSEGAGAASGICNAKDPIKTMEEMIAATRRAADDLKKLGKQEFIMIFKNKIKVESDHKEVTFHNVTAAVKETVKNSGIKDGIVVVYSHHTTCSVITQECAFDMSMTGRETLQQDLVDVFEKICPSYTREGLYLHPGPKALKFAEEHGEDARGCHNTEAHLISSIIGRNVTAVIDDGEIDLGEFGFIYFIDWDKTRGRTRTVQIMVIGEQYGKTKTR